MGNDNHNGQATGLQGKAGNPRPSETRAKAEQALQDEAEQALQVFDNREVKAKYRMGTEAPRGFPVSFLAGLPIPSPGITVIGARTEGGKTTAMVNIFREMLAAGKCVMFITLEQRAAEIYTMLCMSKARADNRHRQDKKQIEELQKHYSPGAGKGRSQGYTSAFITYYHEKSEQQHPLIMQADNHYQDLMESGKLILLDGVGMEGWSYPALQDYITRKNPDAVIIDYLQIMQAVEDGRFTGYERIADIAKKLISIGNDRTVITGAQFNRLPGEEGKEGKDKHGTFDPVLDRFREAADIEHAASLALGIGYWTQDNGERGYFYKVLKSRYGGAGGARYLQSTGTTDRQDDQERKNEDFRWAYAKPSGDEWQRSRPAEAGSPSNGKASAGGGEKTYKELQQENTTAGDETPWK